ncbi:hypothetical protein M0Q97_09080 [Candidatus Dojkabacteria bacterium]|jgi:hypothetical protein|nr:hypothetical protein [Candidatus Dojkabacteria bacterium]
MIVVANTHMLNIFKQIPIFKLDLGNNFISLKEEKVIIKDPFMLKYLNMTGKQIMTYGIIGKLKFYQDYTLPDKEFYIFNNESIYGLNYTSEDAKIKPEIYLASLVKEINDKEGIKNDDDDVVNNKSKNPDMKLPTEQYIEEMIKKRRMENE